MQFPVIDPIALRIGALELRWYGIMYLLAFSTAWALGRYRVRLSQSMPHPVYKPWTVAAFDDLLTLGMIGVILGGRLGFILFYDLANYLRDPLEILRIWNGGMSFHGGLLGVLAAMWFYARRNKRYFLEIMDFVAPFVAPGLFFGRIGNFINGELWGSVSSMPWAVVFPHAGPLARHPSQLYEALLEGLVLFIIVWVYSTKPRKIGSISGLFAICYGVARFLVEFVRVPDAHLGYVAFGWMTMGQVLSLPLILVGLWLFLRKEQVVTPIKLEQATAPMKKRKQKAKK